MSLLRDTLRRTLDEAINCDTRRYLAIHSGRQRQREAEAGEDAGVEAGHGADPGAGEGEHHQPDRVVAAGLRVADIETKGRLVVGPGRQQPGGPPGPERR